MKAIFQNIKENYRLIIITLIIGFFLGWLFFNGDPQAGGSDSHEIESHNGHDHEAEQPTVWTCSMHPQIKQDKFGLCPICAMDLIPLTTMTASGDGVDPNEIVMSESAAKLAEIQTMVVKLGSPEKTLHLQGKVAADERNIAKLTARYGGRIEKLFRYQYPRSSTFFLGRRKPPERCAVGPVGDSTPAGSARGR